MMSPAEFKRACSLYKQYKTEHGEYPAIAERHGLSLGDLNRKCWKHFAIERENIERDKAAKKSVTSRVR
jgi:hypothetical protein